MSGGWLSWITLHSSDKWKHWKHFDYIHHWLITHMFLQSRGKGNPPTTHRHEGCEAHREQPHQQLFIKCVATFCIAINPRFVRTMPCLDSSLEPKFNVIALTPVLKLNPSSLHSCNGAGFSHWNDPMVYPPAPWDSPPCIQVTSLSPSTDWKEMHCLRAAISMAM